MTQITASQSHEHETGAVTAEFAIVLPAVLLVLVMVISSIQLTSVQLMLTSAAAEVARLEARGDIGAAQQVLARTLGSETSPTAGSGARRVQRATIGEMLCVTLTAAPLPGPLAGLQATGRGCAAISKASS